MATTSPSAERRLRGFLSRFDPPVARVARAARDRIRKLLPAAIEIVYDNYNVLAMGFGPSERASEVIVSVAAFPRWVSVFFMRGALLPDPHALLKGGGRQVRHIVLGDPSMLDQPAVKALLKAAIKAHPTAVDPAARGRTIIKSVSKKQRPRRPSAPRGRARKGKARR
jgi:hypothetical protein